MKNSELRTREKSKKQKANIKDVEKEQFNFIFLHIFTFCFLTFAFFCSSAAADNLGFKFQPGDKYLLSSVTEEKITMTADDKEQVLNRTTRIDCDLDVEEVNDNGFAWAKYTFRRTWLKIKGPDIEVDFDSTGENKKIYSKAMPLLLVINEGFYIRISPTGKVVQLNGMQEVISNVKSNIPRTRGRDISPIINDINEMLSESSIRQKLEEQLAVFPDSSRGNEWTRTAEVNSKKIMQTWDYRLKKGKDGIVVLDANLESTPVIDSEEVVAGGITYKHQTSGRGQGQIEIDLNVKDARPIIKSVITQDLIEEYKGTSQGPVLRVPQIAEPLRTHSVSIFQMTRRESPAKAGEPHQPTDVNH